MNTCWAQMNRLRKGEDRAKVAIGDPHLVLPFPESMDFQTCYEFLCLNAESLSRIEIQRVGIADVVSIRVDSTILGQSAIKFAYVTASTKLDELYEIAFQIR